MAGKPSLDIPIGSPDLQAFKSKMTEASSHVGTVSRQIAKQALGMNDAIKTGLMASASSMALGVMGRIAVIVGMVKIVGGAVSAVSDQLQRMVDIADKSANTGFSPEMWQSWVSGAKGAQEKIGQFEGALQNAFQALKPVLNPDWSVWDDGLKKVTAVERAMLGMRELFTEGQDYSGVDMFRSAKTQDEQLAAALTYMKQLQAIGRDVAAWDLAEKLFGSAFADKIRTNQISIDELLENIRTKSPDAFSTEIVLRAKELDTQLKNAWHTIDQNLHPSMEALDSIALSLKSVWVDIVELMAKASKLLNPTFTGSNSLAVQLSATGEPGLQTPILDGTVSNESRPRVEIDTTPASDAVPMPRRRPTDAPAPPKQEAGGVDRFETSAEGIERRIAALRAEAQTLDLSSSARDRARVAAQLQTVAMQANAAAGLGANVVTDAQRKRIEEVADAYGKASEAIARAKVAGTIGFGRETAFLTSEDVAIANQLKDIYPNVATAMASVEAQAMRNNEAMRGLSGTISSELTSSITDLASNNKSLGDSFIDMSKVVVRAINEMLVKLLIVQPLMRGLQGGLGGLGFADGGMIGDAGSITVGNQSFPKFAEGGPIRGPGTGRSDSIPILASNGEFMVNAEATARHRSLLEAINSGTLPAFADGGIVGSVPAAEGGMIGNVGAGVQMNVGGITVNGSAGTPQQNDDLVKKMVAAMKDQASALVTKELRQQMRPGGLFKGN